MRIPSAAGKFELPPTKRYEPSPKWRQIGLRQKFIAVSKKFEAINSDQSSNKFGIIQGTYILSLERCWQNSTEETIIWYVAGICFENEGYLSCLTVYPKNFLNECINWFNATYKCDLKCFFVS